MILRTFISAIIFLLPFIPLYLVFEPFANLEGFVSSNDRTHTEQQKRPAEVKSEAEILARLLYSECRGEKRLGRIAVGQVVMDRIQEGRWGSTLKEVVLAPNQFAPLGELTETLLADAEAVLAGERAFPSHKVLFFRSKVSHQEDWWAPYIQHIDNHAFYGSKI